MLLSREQARTIGLVEEGSLYVTVADDRLVECQSALIEIEVGGKTRTGTVALSTGAGDILVGMDFLRTFKLGLYISKDTVLLYDEDEAAAS
jgi:predicted aspartyl protease